MEYKWKQWKFYFWLIVVSYNFIPNLNIYFSRNKFAKPNKATEEEIHSMRKAQAQHIPSSQHLNL